MTGRAHGGIAIGLLLAGGVAALAQAAARPPASARETPVHHARGTFEVKVTPLEQDTPLEGAVLGRMSLDKQFLGDLVGSSHGEMLTASNGVEGSGAYVALERVSGTLAGRRGTFVLQHAGTRTPGQPQQIAILVVPDSGTGELAGLLGRLTIHMGEGKHTYDLEYTLPGAP